MKRNIQIDFIKGAAIILMVFCHAIDNSYLPVLHFVALFHMPVFVIAAGYFFSTQKVATLRDLTSFTARKVQRLWLPYVLAMGAFVLLHNFFIRIGFYTTDPDFLVLCRAQWTSLARFYGAKEILHNLFYTLFMLHGEQVGGAMWFLQMMFWVYVFYSCVDYVLIRLRCNPIVVQTLISIIILLVARHFTLGRSFYFGGMRTFAAYGLFHVGVLLRYYAEDLKSLFSKVPVWLPCAWGFLLLLALMPFERGSLTGWSYRTVPTFLIAAIAGWFFLAGAYNLCARYCAKIANGVAWVGGYTMSIMIFHLIAFKIVNLVAVHFQGGELSGCLIPGRIRVRPLADNLHGFWNILSCQFDHDLQTTNNNSF